MTTADIQAILSQELATMKGELAPKLREDLGGVAARAAVVFEDLSAGDTEEAKADARHLKAAALNLAAKHGQDVATKSLEIVGRIGKGALAALLA